LVDGDFWGDVLVYYDWIVNGINGTGGISVVFKELAAYMHDSDDVRLVNIAYDGTGDLNFKPRILERYRDVIPHKAIVPEGVFHSTYYRLPENRDLGIVTTVHDFTYERALGGMKKIVHSMQKRRAILHSDKIVCVSKNTADDLKFYIPEVDFNKVEVVHNGVSDLFSISDNVNEYDSYVLFVGARSRYKNFYSAVLAVAALDSQYRLVCVGGGAFTDQELKFLRNNLGSSRFCHAGYVSQLELRDYYRSAYALIYPSLYEGFGIPLLEAFKCGCPVVAVNSSSIPEVSGDAALLAAAGNPQDLFVELQKLGDLSLRSDVIQRGLNRSLMFSWTSTAKNTLDLYRDIGTLC
jgi:mannosyltransferase